MSEDLGRTVGVLLVGVLLTATLYGITTLQTYMWYRNYPKDPLYIQAVVWSLLFLDTVHVALSMHVIYYYVILNFNNPTALKMSVWSFDGTIVLTAVITCIAHGFYARRVYILADRNWMLPLVIGILSCTRLLCAFITVQRLLVIKVIADLSQKIGALVGIGLGAGCLADWIILVALVFLLRRRRSGMKDTDSLIDKLIYWTVNNGLFTSILNVCVIVTLLGMPDNMIYFALDLLLSKLYANSLLATLNYRSVAHGRGTDDTEPAYPLSPLRAQQTGDTLRFNPTTTVAGVKPVVHVMTTTITDAPFSSQAMEVDGGDQHSARDGDSKVYPLGNVT